MLRSKIPSLHLSRFSKRAQYLFAEGLVVVFGLTTCQLFLNQPEHVSWGVLVPCFMGYLASFALLLTTRCDSCNEPVGRERGRLVALPHTHCTRCGTNLS